MQQKSTIFCVRNVKNYYLWDKLLIFKGLGRLDCNEIVRKDN